MFYVTLDDLGINYNDDTVYYLFLRIVEVAEVERKESEKEKYLL